MSENSKTWKFIGIALIVYMIIWFWPVIFHRPFFNNQNSDMKIESFPYNGRYVQIAPSDHPEYKDFVIESDSEVDSNFERVDDFKIVTCTMEAKQCPDGSYVGRTGSNCEFTPCP